MTRPIFLLLLLFAPGLSFGDGGVPGVKPQASLRVALMAALTGAREDALGPVPSADAVPGPPFPARRSCMPDPWWDM